MAPVLSEDLSSHSWDNGTQYLIYTLMFESIRLRDALRLSMEATSWTSSLPVISLDGPGPPQQRDPRFRKLVEGILYSRGFVPSYNAVVFGFVAFITLRYWSGKAFRYQRSRQLRSWISKEDSSYRGDFVIKSQRAQTDSSSILNIASSSGSSTLEVIDTPSPKTIESEEDTPLLHYKRASLPKYTLGSIWALWRAFIMYQPPPTRLAVELRSMPSMGTSIIILAFTALNAFYIFHHINFNVLELFVLADRCGLVFVVNLPLLYLTSAKTQPLKFLTGHSYESLNIFHRRLGELMCLEAMLHTAGMIGVWYTLLRPTGFTIIHFVFNKTILTGLAAFTGYELLYITARPFFRQLCYEIFLALHVFLQMAALILLFFHHTSSRVYVGIALGIFVIDRLLYRIILKSTTMMATSQIMEDGETVRLSGTITFQHKSILNRIIGRTSGGWKAADHVFLTIPSLSRKHLFQAHPFTIASPAPISNTDEAKLEFLIRAQGGFSADLLRAATQHSSLLLRIDGPYGTDHARNILTDSDVAILVAGGSGIAVIWPLVHFLLNQTRSTDTKVVSKTQLLMKKIVLVWIVHQTAHISWIGSQDLQDIDDKGVEVIIPQATEEVGRPDLEEILGSIVLNTKLEKRVGVVGSGPDSMGRTVRNTCARLVRNGHNVEVTIEKFGW